MGQRYTVFLNDRSVQISETINRPDYQSNKRIIPFEGKEQLTSEYERFKADNHCECLEIYSYHLYKETVEAFNSLFTPLKAAGGMVRNPEGKLLFIKRLGFWDLPKGKIEENESPEEAAIREVEEETGVSGLQIIRSLKPTFHIYTDKRERCILKETSWFEMQSAGIQVPVPQLEESITSAEWFDRAQVKAALPGTYASLRALIEDFLPAD